jgi:hypothetical protein
VGSYLYDSSEVESQFIPWPSAARYAAENAREIRVCQICLKPRAPRNYYELDEVADWAKLYAIGESLRSAQNRILPEDFEHCICCDSQLQATIAIPRQVIELIAPLLSSKECAFICNRLQVAACGICRNSKKALLASSHAILDVYLRLHRIDERTFEKTRDAITFHRIARYIDDAQRKIAS